MPSADIAIYCHPDVVSRTATEVLTLVLEAVARRANGSVKTLERRSRGNGGETPVVQVVREADEGRDKVDVLRARSRDEGTGEGLEGEWEEQGEEEIT